jgi:hypothetical protein
MEGENILMSQNDKGLFLKCQQKMFWRTNASLIFDS